MDDPLRHHSPRFLIGLAAIYAIAIALAPMISTSSDLFPLWVAGRLIGTGEAGHIYASVADGLIIGDPIWRTLAASAGVTEMTAYVQPPWVAAAAAPLAKSLTFRQFGCLAHWINLAALLAAGILALRHWAPEIGSAGRLAIMALLPASGVGLALIYYNQTQSLIVLAMLAGLVWAERRPWTAGLVLGVAAAVKLTPILIAGYWIVSGRWRAAAAALVTVSAIAGLDLGLMPEALNAGFATNLREIASTLNLAGSNHAPIKLAYAWFDREAVGPLVRNVGRTIALPPIAGLSLNGLASLTVLALGLAARRCTDERRRDCDALMLMATVPFAPIAWNHYYVAVLLAGIVLLDRRGAGPKLAFAAVAGLLSLGNYVVSDETGLTLATLSNLALLWGAAAILVRPLPHPLTATQGRRAFA